MYKFADSIPMVSASTLIIFILSLIHERIRKIVQEIICKILSLQRDDKKEDILIMMLHLSKFPKILGSFCVSFPISTLVRLNWFMHNEDWIIYLFSDIQSNLSIFGDSVSIQIRRKGWREQKYRKLTFAVEVFIY